MYDINKSEVATSCIWNNETKTIEVCQVVRLYIPADENRTKMIIAEDKRIMSINFDLSVEFEVGTDLGAERVEQNSGSTNVDSYIEACKCDGVQSFTCDPSPLQPNSELIVCIKSVSPDVEINFLDSMVSAS